jgi:two-component system nitrate/nitrite response regulator NarL
VVGSTGDATAAAALVRRCAPDLTMVDLHLGAPGGLRAISTIRHCEPRHRIVAMSGADEETLALEALRAGAEGYLPKASAPEDLIPMLRAVLEGWSVLPRALLAPMLGLTRGHTAARLDLRPEERHLLRLIAAGCSTVEIADGLHVSERTVKRLTAALLRKLRVSSRTQAAALAGDAGLL